VSRYVSGSSARRDALDSIGFIWGRLQSGFNLLLEALVIYKQLYGTAEVPLSFVVPTEEPWPEAVRGMRQQHLLPISVLA
jgi:hypothetical protein